MDKNDVELFARFQKSPFLFIEKSWGLVPQPLKPDVPNDLPAEAYASDMFEPFQKGVHLTWQQWLLIRGVEWAINRGEKKRIAIESGQGTGKTAVLAMLIIWFLFSHKDARVPCTAPTVEQMYDALWREVYLWLDRLPGPIKNLFEWTSDMLKVRERPNTWFARARTSRKEKPEALAGIHGEHILVVCDEASGIDDEIFRIAEGVLTGENVIFIMFSQHQRLFGYFHRAFHEEKEDYQLLSFNSLESPIVDMQFVDRIAKAYGIDSDPWRIQVEGKAPKEDAVDDQGYVSLLSEADIRLGDDGEFGRCKLGIDPSAAGEDSTEWCIRDAVKAKIVKSEAISTSLSIASLTLSILDQFTFEDPGTFIDNFGVGADVRSEILKLSKTEKDAIGINTADPSSDPERYLNTRAEIFWKAREWLLRGGVLVGEGAKDLKKEMLCIKYRYGPRGLIQIMPKEIMKKKGIKSPNKADAFALTFCGGEFSERKERAKTLLQTLATNPLPTQNLSPNQAYVAGLLKQREQMSGTGSSAF